MPHILRAIHNISRCGMQYRTEKMTPLGLKAIHSSYLLEISRNPGISQEQLSKAICIDKSNVARQAAILEEDGFILRRPCENDRRVIRLYPTEKTLQLLPQIRQILRQWRILLTQDLSEEEQLLLDSLLAKLKQRACDYLEEQA